MTENTPPQPDRIDGAPHPRDTPCLIGQGPAQAAFLGAFNGGRLHHGWLLTGPRGVGKATLAWTIARFLLATPARGADDGLFGAPPDAETLEVPYDHPVATRVRAGSDPGVFLLRRGGAGKTEAEQHKNFEEGRFSAYIRVDEVRKLARFLHLSSADAGQRVVIVDAADEMNAQAANALLKMLEEPPARTTLVLISHAPARLLPTIRSRCRELRLGALAPDDMAAALAQAGIETEAPQSLAALAAGSVGEAVRLSNLGGVEIYSELLGLLSGFPDLDRQRAIRLAETAAARGAEDRLDVLISLLDRLLARLARTGATGVPPDPVATPDEAEILARLAPDAASARAWAECAQDIGARARQARSVNLDPAALVLDTVFRLKQTAA